MAAWISSALLKQTWKSSLSRQLWFGKTCTERGFGICVNVVKLSWSRKEELAGFPKRIQRSRGSGLVLVHLNLHAQLQTSASSESEEFLPSSGSGKILVCVTGNRQKKESFYAHFTHCCFSLKEPASHLWRHPGC